MLKQIQLKTNRQTQLSLGGIDYLALQTISVVLDDRTIKELTFDKTFSSFYLNTQLNLPSGRPYFLYSSINFETVNAVRDDLRSKIIQFNKELFKHGHSVIPKSDLDLTDYNCKVVMKDEPNCQLFFKAGVQVGDKFWMMQIKTADCK